ncbi:MAG: helix-turn-helix transcriptional regulator [Fimbriimonadaceae bacterium]|nr:helix-turn-helix transcriptional regulator [Fimbriimonadaceae bacterium]
MMQNPELLLALTHHRHAIGIIAELWGSEGAKLVTLVYRTGASEGATKQTLSYLIERGWVVKNPGYGHPWRPEYLLTPQGEVFGAACARVVELAREQMAQDVAFDKWSLPALYSVLSGARRHKEVKASLPSITPRALSQSLANLEGVGWIEKAVISVTPLRIEYRPTPIGESWQESLQHFVELLKTNNG